MEKILSSEYYINYNGQVIDIKDSSKILCLFVGGGGFGDGGPDRTWWSKFELYRTNDFGKSLTKVGEASENGNGYDVSCQFTLEDQECNLNRIGISQLFNSIFKRDIL